MVTSTTLNTRVADQMDNIIDIRYVTVTPCCVTTCAYDTSTMSLREYDVCNLYDHVIYSYHVIPDNRVTGIMSGYRGLEPPELSLVDDEPDHPVSVRSN